VLDRYTADAYPKFSTLFESLPESSPLRALARSPEEAALAIVLENSSKKDITAIGYRWHLVDDHGDHRTHIHSADSYFVDVYLAVAKLGSRHLLTESGSLDEALIEHVQGGGGLLGSGSMIRMDPARTAVEAVFTIDFVMFADGDIADDDRDHYGLELQCRKPAAEFIAKQIRLAIAENRDVTPVLSALAAIPRVGSKRSPQGDPLVRLVQRYAGDYLRTGHRKFGDIDMREAKLRHFESRPDLPKFYRRGS
jgi:hypothetical protein